MMANLLTTQPPENLLYKNPRKILVFSFRNGYNSLITYIPAEKNVRVLCHVCQLKLNFFILKEDQLKLNFFRLKEDACC